MSFDHHDRRFVEDPESVIGAIREEEPLLHSDLYGGFWLLTRYDDVTQAALDHDSFTSSVVGTTIIPPSQPRSYPLLPIELDPPGHSQYRGLVNALFTKPRIDALRPQLEALASRLLEPIARNGGGEVVSEFAIPMSLGALAGLMNLPEEDEERWFDWVERMFGGALIDKDDQREAVRDVEAYLDALIAERKEEPRDDFIGMLLEAEVEGRSLSELEVRAFGVLMLLAGYETTSGAMGLSLMHLAEHVEQRAQLFADPGGLAHSAVNELLRYVSPVQVFCRNAAHDLDLHGKRVPAGDVVLLAYGAANHDPRAFPDPDRCILDRRPNRHLAFGHGRHLCLGANLARLELTIMIERFAELFPDFELDPERPPTWKPRGDIRGLATLDLIGPRKTS
ncbi:MAG TPA: cytochrome P450 [Gaiellaceae bacterium]|nr:cytochrome P450 [Gaiellaceae bacterium]